MDTARKLVEELRALVEQPNTPIDKCKSLISKLKIEMTKFHQSNDPNVAMRENLIARETLELAAILSAKSQDDKAFERYVAQLKPYYYDYSHTLPDSTRRTIIMGLYLLYLLTEEGRIEDFHTELELLQSARTDRYIVFATEIERDIMEGRYNKLWQARANVPTDIYIFFVEKLMKTIRSDIAECLEASYQTLRVPEAAKLLMFSNADKEFHAFVDQKGWMITDDQLLHFTQDHGHKLELPATSLINEMLKYAHEIERII